MIEEKLQAAADRLPGPRGDYLDVEDRVRKKQVRPKAASRKRLVTLILLAVLLVGCVAVTEPDYHLYNGNWWSFVDGVDEIHDMTGQDWKDTQKAAEKLGITLPENLGGYPVIGFSRYNLTNQKTVIQLAWLFPRYVYQSSYYGVEMEESYVSPDGIQGTRHWREGADVTYGSTEDEIWRRQFGYDENDVFIGSNYTTGQVDTEGIASQEYAEQTIYVGKVLYDTLDLPIWVVTWVDNANGVVFSLDGEFETPDTLIEYAKQIIDLNT